MTETLYWWFRPDISQKKMVTDYIFNKYQFKVLRNTIMDREGMITNHSKKYSKDYYENHPVLRTGIKPIKEINPQSTF